jgi:hypothetical protein
MKPMIISISKHTPPYQDHPEKVFNFGDEHSRLRDFNISAKHFFRKKPTP